MAGEQGEDEASRQRPQVHRQSQQIDLPRQLGGGPSENCGEERKVLRTANTVLPLAFGEKHPHHHILLVSGTGRHLKS